MAGHEKAPTWTHKDHPSFLAIVLLSNMLLQPLFDDLLITHVVISIFTSLIILSSTLSLLGHKKLVIFLLILAFPALVVEWLEDFIETTRAYECLRLSLWIVVWGFIIQTQLLAFLRSPTVTKDTLWRAISTYIMIGILWSALYKLVATVSPAAFNGLASDASTGDFQYFSFTVLTTLGFGDITPAIPFARSLVIVESIVGPLYIAVLIATAVSEYKHRPYQKEPKDSEESR